LTAAGYKETRIFTPERVNRPSRSSTPSPIDAADVADSDEGLGRKIANFLSAWMPAASISLGRARGAEIARSGPDFAPDEAGGRGRGVSPGNLVAPRQGRSLPPPRVGSSRPRPPLPVDFISSSSSSSRIAPPAHSQKPTPTTLSPKRPGHVCLPSSKTSFPVHLRMAASSPNLKQSAVPSSCLRHSVFVPASRSPLSSDKENETYRGRRPGPSRHAESYSHHLLKPQRSQVALRRAKTSTVSPRFDTASHNPSVQPLAPVLMTNEVLCRSTPGSRSASRSRYSSHRGTNRSSVADDTIPPVPPLLSAEVIEKELSAWLYAKPRSNALTTPDKFSNRDSDDDDLSGDSDAEPGLGDIVVARLSSSASATTSTTRSSVKPSSGPRPRPIAHEQKSSLSVRPTSHKSRYHIKVSSQFADDTTPSIRKQGSMQSLRVHLRSSNTFSHASQVQAGPSRPLEPRAAAHATTSNQTLSQLALAEIADKNYVRTHSSAHRNHTIVRRPSFFARSSRPNASLADRREDAWLEGPEWDGAVHRSARAPKREGRGLIPWFGGERQFLQNYGDIDTMEWDE
jgi:hypothetical protein